MARTVEQIEYQLVQARRERDAWQKNRGGSHHYQIPEARKKQLRNILCSFDSLWGKYVRDKQDIKMLNEMNSTTWYWPENITW